MASLQSLASFKESFGAGIVGSWIMATLYGVACAQTYNYFNVHTHDAIWLKGTVVFVWILETIHACIVYAFSYYYLVSSAFDPVASAKNVWFTSGSLIVRIILKIVYFAYFTRLAFQLSDRRSRWPIVVVLVVVTVVHASFGFVAGVRMLVSTDLTDYIKNQRSIEDMAITQFVADLVLMSILAVVLQKHKTAFKRTNAMINRLIIFTVSRGILTAIAASVEFFALALYPDEFWYTAMEYAMGGLYANSLLLTLNARNAIRKAGQATEQSSFTVPLAGIIVKAEGEESTRGSEDTLQEKAADGLTRSHSDERTDATPVSVKNQMS